MPKAASKTEGFALTAPREAWLPAIRAANDPIERRNTIPILANLLLKADEAGRLTVSGTDLDVAMTARTEIDAGRLPDEGLTLPAALLVDIIDKLPPKSEVTLKEDGGRVIVSAGRSRFTVHTLPGGDWPAMRAREDDGTAATFALPAGRLAAMLALTAFAISTEETRYYLNGIFMHAAPTELATDDRLRMVATDGHRLSLADLPMGETVLPAFHGVIIPRKTVRLLQKALKAAGDETEVEVGVTQSAIHFEIGSVRILSKVIDGTFPDYQRVIPSGGGNVWRFGAHVLAEAVGRVTTISSERGRAVRVEFGRDTARLSVSNPDAGEASEEAQVAGVEGDDVEIGFNGAYFAEILTLIDGPTRLELADNGSPALFIPAPREGETIENRIVLMPMRV